MIITQVLMNCYNRMFLSAALYHHLLPRLKKEAYDHLKYWKTAKGCPSLIQCYSLLRPWWMGSEGHIFFFFGLIA